MIVLLDLYHIWLFESGVWAKAAGWCGADFGAKWSFSDLLEVVEACLSATIKKKKLLHDFDRTIIRAVSRQKITWSTIRILLGKYNPYDLYERTHSKLLMRPIFDTISLKKILCIWLFISQDTTAKDDSSRSLEPSLSLDNTLVSVGEISRSKIAREKETIRPSGNLNR